MTHLKTLFLALCLLPLISLQAFAGDDEGLYAPPAPDGSTFFRFVQADGNADAVIPQAGGKSYDALAFEGVSAYFVMPEGTLNFTMNEATSSEELKADHYYSVILSAGALHILEDQKIENIQKSLIGLYNLTDQDTLSLKTADKGIAIIEDVASSQNGAREINALKIDLEVVNADDSVKKALEPLVLERTQAFSVFAFQNAAGEITLKSVKAETDTTK
ncbi:MAG: alginate O-acetyltransferase AlgF [Rhodospirillales bacterium]|nr:alginate O-acetyltransferase AlgF [Rhodospirillales bacterium]